MKRDIIYYLDKLREAIFYDNTSGDARIHFSMADFQNLANVLKITKYVNNTSEALDRVKDMVSGHLDKEFTFVLYGWTPDFNDGEPCVHEQRLVINGFDDNGYNQELWDKLRKEYPAKEDYYTVEGLVRSAFEKTVKTLGLHKLFSYPPCLLDLLGTNWRIEGEVYGNGQEPKLVILDYDPGY
jgi:hypothetical protein